MEKLEILITDADKYSGDIREMSDFFGIAFNEVKNYMCDNSSVIDVKIPISELGVINCIYDGVATIAGEKTSYVLNFDALPKVVKEKLDSGDYVIGESRQVDGDFRAVIIDKETKLRVKDVTIKKQNEAISGKVANPNALNNLFVQAQLKQIIEKIDYISTMQDYQIKSDRNRFLIDPFLNARDEIRSAQEIEDKDHQRKKLENAIVFLNDVSNAAFQDSLISAQKIVENKAGLFFGAEKTLRAFMGFVAEDWFFFSKAMSLKLVIYNYLENYIECEHIMKDFLFKSHEFCNKKFSNNKYSYAMYINMVAPYSSQNTWSNLIKITNRNYDSYTLFEQTKEVEYLEIKES